MRKRRRARMEAEAKASAGDGVGSGGGGGGDGGGADGGEAKGGAASGGAQHDNEYTVAKYLPEVQINPMNRGKLRGVGYVSKPSAPSASTAAVGVNATSMRYLQKFQQAPGALRGAAAAGYRPPQRT